jgi:hypothetical protein
MEWGRDVRDTWSPYFSKEMHLWLDPHPLSSWNLQTFEMYIIK